MFNGQKRGVFFEKIKTGHKIKLGGKFISSHLEYSESQPLPENWIQKIDTVVNDLVILEEKHPTPAGNFSTLESSGLKTPAEVCKWIGRDALGAKRAIFGVNLSQTHKLFLDTPNVYVVDQESDITYKHSVAKELLPLIETIIMRSENKFKGSKISHEPATGKTEDELYHQGFNVVAGMDEAGRGAWAGPIVGAVVAISRQTELPPVCDSKGLTEESRMSMRKSLIATVPYGVGIVEADEIDQIGIEKANKLIFMRAFEALTRDFPEVKVDIIMIDGNPIKPDQVKFPIEYRCITQGEKNSKAIAAASIIAKTERDIIMTKAAITFPGFGFEAHKGYGTPQHQMCLAKEGPCEIHRKCFGPIKVLCQAQEAKANGTGQLEMF